MIDPRIYEMFREIGHDLYVANMISSHGGNLSVRLGDRVIIKRRGAMLGQLKPHDLVETRLDKNDSGVALASTELLVHRTVYLNTPALAICHCHPRTAIAYSLSRDEIVPIDNEASYLLKKIPVIAEEFASGSPQLANKVAATLKNYKILMLRGHGSFATGQTLDEAFLWSSTLEEACQIMLLAKQIDEPFIEYRGMSGSYDKF
ncbi:MAG: class II aldolase/adducin family protein [Thermoflexales bacterium]|nr:class II aldolase/adducin family protein [Thermoflexales bacterium]